MSGPSLSWLIIPVIWFGFVGFMMVLVFFVGLWEKRMVWPYVSSERQEASSAGPGFDEQNPFAPSTVLSVELSPAAIDYAIWAGKQATRLGFTSLGLFHDVRGGLYQVRYEFWRAGSGDVLALVGAGTLAKIATQTTWLYTRRADGTYVVSLDNEKGTYVDLANLTVEGLNPGAQFTTLLEWHRARIAAAGVPVLPFTEADPLAAYRQFRTHRTDQLERAGLITYLDPDRNLHRFTPRGSSSYTLRMHARMYGRKLWPDTRRKLHRPAGRPPLVEAPDSV